MMDEIPQFDDETLMAFADGELDAAAARQVEQVLSLLPTQQVLPRDRALAAKIAWFMLSAALVRQALAARGAPGMRT